MADADADADAATAEPAAKRRKNASRKAAGAGIRMTGKLGLMTAGSSDHQQVRRGRRRLGKPWFTPGSVRLPDARFRPIGYPPRAIVELEQRLAHDVFDHWLGESAYWETGRRKLYEELYYLCFKHELSTFVTPPRGREHEEDEMKSVAFARWQVDKSTLVPCWCHQAAPLSALPPPPLSSPPHPHPTVATTATTNAITTTMVPVSLELALDEAHFAEAEEVHGILEEDLPDRTQIVKMVIHEGLPLVHYIAENVVGELGEPDSDLKDDAGEELGLCPVEPEEYAEQDALITHIGKVIVRWGEA